MNEFEKTLELIQSKKISLNEGIKLLKVLSPRLAKINQSTLEKLISQTDNGLTTEELGEIFDIVNSEIPLSQTNQKISAKTAKVVCLAIDSPDGSEFRINLPLGLAQFAIKMIPKDAQMTMKERGLDTETIIELLKNDLPNGEILSLESSDGTEVRLEVE